ncbi:MAG: hypothetical protein OXQ86_11610 [Gammaproteobacteria bacterium]|nr:hypothetical protein [Gammaproteobacteria bacterium]MDE0415239.1 hypothetical protein [Gammaproteobacteria bacterium]
MSKTRHIQKRMNQRGIDQQLIDVATRFGRAVHCKDGKKIYLNRKGAQKAIRTIDRFRKSLTAAVDKGGVVLVAAPNGLEITTYRLNSYQRRRRNR